MDYKYYQMHYLNLNMYVAEHIKRIRESRHLTQIEVAAALSMTRQAYSKLENNMTNINIDHIEKLCNIFHVCLTDFFPPHMLCMSSIETSRPSSLPHNGTTHIPMVASLETKELLRLISGFASLSSIDQKAILEFIDRKLL